MKLLLIEDNASIIMGLEYLLREEGFRCDTARTAAEAEQAAGRERYDLVLLDISLPDGDGFRRWYGSLIWARTIISSSLFGTGS